MNRTFIHSSGGIVQVVADGKPGGGTTAVLTLSGLLQDAGFAVHVVSEEGSYLLAEADRLGMATYGLAFGGRLHTGATALRLARLVDAIRPAVVHGHGARAGLPLALAMRMRMRMRQGVAPLFAYTVHGFHYVAKLPPIRQLGQAAEAVCIATADWTNFVSDADCQRAVQDGLLRRARSHSVVKNAVTVPESFGTRGKRHDIGFVGRLIPQKNPLLLVDILAALRPGRPSLAVIGGGALQAELRDAFARAGLSSQVTMLGECSREQALAHLSACRVLVLPSLWEGHPITLIEAMHVGVPVVASDIAGSNEIVVPGETGWLVPARAAHQYARRIADLLANESGQLSMGAAAMRLAAVQYSPQRVLDAHLAHYGVLSGEQRS